MTYTPFGPVPDTVADPDRLATDLAAVLADLLGLAGCALVEVVDAALGGELGPRAEVLFDQLRVLADTAGAPELPCCRGDDDDAVAAWAAVVTGIAGSRRLPGR